MPAQNTVKLVERTASGHFAKGTSGNPAGRKLGAGNKINVEIRTMVKQALSELGGVDYLVEVGRRKPEVFLGLVAKLIPAEIKASVMAGDGLPMVEIRDYSGRRPGISVTEQVEHEQHEAGVMSNIAGDDAIDVAVPERRVGVAHR